MPIFDYVCELCRKQFEVKVPLEKVKDLVLCPKCGKPLRKKIYAVPFRIN